MNTVGKAKTTRGTRNGRHRPVRWFSVLMSVAVLAVSGAVVADVVLVYVANTSAVNGPSPFQFVNGANEADAVKWISTTTVQCTNGATTSTCPSGGASLLTTLGAVPTVTEQFDDLVEFQNAIVTPAVSSISAANIQAFVPTGFAKGTVVCAYAFVSDEMPSPGFAPVPGAALGCLATLPSFAGAAPASCSDGGLTNPPGYVTIDLLAASATPSSSWTCGIASGQAVPTTGLSQIYISYDIQTSAPVTTAVLDGFTIGVVGQ